MTTEATTQTKQTERSKWNQFTIWVGAVPVWVWFILIGVLMITNYSMTKESLLAQSAWLTVVRTGATVNFVLFLFFVYSRLLNKGIAKMHIKVNSLLGLLLWLVGIGILVLIMRLTGNFETVFG